jgi:hypothetical protein
VCLTPAPVCHPPGVQLYYPATLSPYALILSVLSQAGTLALPASQLFVLREDRGRVLRDFRVRFDWVRHDWVRFDWRKESPSRDRDLCPSWRVVPCLASV